MTPQPIAEIEPQRRYPLKDAAAFCPSPRGGVMTPRSLHHAIRRGDLKGEQVNGFWYVWGGELLKWLQVESVPSFGRTPTQRQQALDQARRELRAMGMKG